MTKSITLNGKVVKVHVVQTKDQSGYISENDAEMDLRGKTAVRAAIEKAKVCKKPVAKYDKVSKRAYLEYANGDRNYAN